MFHILLDTEVFRHENLRFKSKRFEQLVAFVAAQEATVYVADVTIGEVRRAIATAVSNALALLPKKTRTALGVLTQTGKAGFSGLLELPRESVLIEDLNAMFDRLIADLKAVKLSSDEVPVAELRERYFQALPPFSDLAAKKHEFPDAIFILAADRHAKSSGHTLHVVSADKGVAEAAQQTSGLEPVATLADMITKVHETVQVTANLAAAAERAFAALTPEIIARVKNLFENSGIEVEDEWEGEASEVEVGEIDLGEPTIDEINGAIVTLGFLAKISFTADVTIADPEQTAYDSETGDLMIFGYLTSSIHATEYDVEGTVAIEVDTANASESEIRDVSLFADNITVRYPWSL